MKTNVTDTDLKSIWPPNALQEHIQNTLKTDVHISKSDKEALERFLNPHDENLKGAYQKLIAKKHPHSLIIKYLVQVYNCLLDISFYHPVKEIDTKDWLRKISNKSACLAKTISHAPSSDLILPDWLSSLDSLLLALLEGYGDEITKDDFLAAGHQLRRSLQKIPVTMLLDSLAMLSQQEVSRSQAHYWENDLGIPSPRKHGDDGKLAHEQILARALKRLTLNYFKQPYNDIVATLANTLLGSEKFSEGNVSKIPI